MIRSIRAPLALIAAVLWTAASAVTEPPPEPIKRGLYEWMGMAPIVVAADVIADDGKFSTVIVRRSIKGGTPEGTEMHVDVRGANRDREMGMRALKFDRTVAYLFLLKPDTGPRKEAFPVFDLVRGIQGARPLPAEGREATLDAARRLAELQERHDDTLLWETLPSFLESDNPVLVDASLELFVKFRRAELELLPLLEPLLDHPRPDVRDRAVLIIGRILAPLQPEELPERAVIVGEITARARRDESPIVRRTAVAALAPLPDRGIDETLRAIAKDDADQNVRFEAEKTLYERTLPGDAPPAS